MLTMVTRDWPDLLFSDSADRAVLSRAVRRGTLRRLGPGIYTGAVDEEPEAVTRRVWRTIVRHELPGAILADRSARAGMPDADGRLHVIHTRRRPLVLSGLSILPRRDAHPDLGVIDLPDGLRQSSVARGLLDNLAGSGPRYLTTAEVEGWVAAIVEDLGEDRLNAVRDEARALAEATGRTAALERLARMIAAALATATSDAVEDPVLQARALGRGYDRRRIERFRALAAVLQRLPPEPMNDLPSDAARRSLLPFYEAYFSNFIEGTEFELDEAAAIVLDGVVSADRPADAHDILGTYAIVADEDQMGRTPATATDLVELLRERHRRVLGGRPEARPGSFKTRPNRAGASTFVEPALVEGTLEAGFGEGVTIIDPFSRAVYAMFLITDVHPFSDGNGRIARIHMNAELAAARQMRIIIPTVYRSNYLAALKAATHNDSFDPLAATLRFAQRYTARIDFSSRAAAEAQLTATNALREPNEADDLGIRLILP